MDQPPWLTFQGNQAVENSGKRDHMVCGPTPMLPCSVLISKVLTALQPKLEVAFLHPNRLGHDHVRHAMIYGVNTLIHALLFISTTSPVDDMSAPQR